MGLNGKLPLSSPRPQYRCKYASLPRSSLRTTSRNSTPLWSRANHLHYRRMEILPAYTSAGTRELESNAPSRSTKKIRLRMLWTFSNVPSMFLRRSITAIYQGFSIFLRVMKKFISSWRPYRTVSTKPSKSNKDSWKTKTQILFSKFCAFSNIFMSRCTSSTEMSN